VSAVRGAAAVAAVAAAAVVAGCGGKAAPASPLAWQGTPVAYRPVDLPTDRIVLAKVRNDSGKPIRLEAAKVVVHDADGKVLRSSARYIAGYAHGLYGAFQKPDPLPPDELKRMGLVITLAPGKTAPLYVAWRLAPGSKEPARVDYGAGSLALPQRTKPAT
jgi:hypothetical protein